MHDDRPQFEKITFRPGDHPCASPMASYPAGPCVQQALMIPVKIGALMAICFLLGGLTAAPYQTNVVEGWTVIVNERLLAEEKAATEKALEILRGQLKQIVRVVPATAVAKLREVTL